VRVNVTVVDSNKLKQRPGDNIFQLELEPKSSVAARADSLFVDRFCDATGLQLCTNPLHESVILDRVRYIRAARNIQVNEPDHFFGALGLLRILKMQKNIFWEKMFTKN